MCAMIASVAGAQQPNRLPAVVVDARPDPPGPRKIAGVVRDTFAIPLDSVEISIVSLQRRTLSKANGAFLFSDIAPGKYDVRARKMGYAPQIQSLIVDSLGGATLFALVPLPHVLRPIVTTVARGGLSGVVGDTAFNALVGAEVHVLGHDQFAATDSLGAFYMPIRAGSYILTVKHPGFAYRLVSVIVPPDSGQRIRVNLAPASQTPSRKQAHNVEDFASRVAWRQAAHSRIYTRAELQTMGIEWVYDAVRMGFAAIHLGPNPQIDRDCTVVVNGGPDTTSLAPLTVEDVETVEVYDVATSVSAASTTLRRHFSTPGAASSAARPGIDPTPMSNTEDAAWANRTKACTLVYVWLR
jgi:hypothetical protein